jgi:hypothetical protein
MPRLVMPLTNARRLLFALLVMGAAAGAGAEPAPRKRPLQVRVPDRAGMAVRRAILAVRQRLSHRECRLVLSDFRSTALGTPLGDVLGARGQTAEEHLDSLVFRSGSGTKACRPSTILAYTHVGGDTVYVCNSQFLRAIASDPVFAEMVLIHEVLHTLGLAENPPSSEQITTQVTERCGARRDRPVQSASLDLSPPPPPWCPPGGRGCSAPPVPR